MEASMRLSRQDRSALLHKLCEVEGFNSIEDMFEATIFDSVSPAICTICGFTAEMEPDQDRGYCESCGANTVVSALVLMGII
jgi:hypothetical protein